MNYAIEAKQDFLSELECLINKYSKENGSDTPDFQLAGYLNDCLETWNKYTKYRDNWYGFKSLSKTIGEIQI